MAVTSMEEYNTFDEHLVHLKDLRECQISSCELLLAWWRWLKLEAVVSPLRRRDRLKPSPPLETAISSVKHQNNLEEDTMHL